MKINVKSIFLAFLLYLGILLSGMFIIYIVQYQYHSDLAEDSAHLTEEWNETGQFVTDKVHLHGCIFLVNNENETSSVLYSYDDSSVYEDFLRNFLSHHTPAKKTKSIYQLAIELNPLTCFVIAGSPIYIDGNHTGSIYIIRTISYLPSVIHMFLLFYTIVYFILLMHYLFIQRINLRITNIYRKYIANISHELKSPLASIHAITETLNAGLVNDEETLHRYYGIIDRESHRLEQSVLDIIELSKIQDQRIDVSKGMTSISDILDPVINRYKDFCEDVGIHFLVDPSLTELPELYTNADRIIQLLQILLDNAAKFTSEGGTISIYAEYDNKKAIFCVSDTGCGMDEETISHIFERFYRGTNTSEYAGSGLGLSIAKEIVHALGERIWAESELGVGTNFYFTVARKKENIFKKIAG